MAIELSSFSDAPASAGRELALKLDRRQDAIGPFPKFLIDFVVLIEKRLRSGLGAAKALTQTAGLLPVSDREHALLILIAYLSVTFFGCACWDRADLFRECKINVTVTIRA